MNLIDWVCSPFIWLRQCLGPPAPLATAAAAAVIVRRWFVCCCTSIKLKVSIGAFIQQPFAPTSSINSFRFIRTSAAHDKELCKSCGSCLFFLSFFSPHLFLVLWACFGT